MLSITSIFENFRNLLSLQNKFGSKKLLPKRPTLPLIGNINRIKKMNNKLKNLNNQIQRL